MFFFNDKEKERYESKVRECEDLRNTINSLLSEKTALRKQMASEQYELLQKIDRLRNEAQINANRQLQMSVDLARANDIIKENDKRIASLRQELRQYQDRAQKQSQFEKAKTDSESRENAADVLISKQKTVIAANNEKIAELENELQKRSGDLEQMSISLHNANKTLEERDRELPLLNKELADMRALLDKAQIDLQNKTAQLDKAKKDIDDNARESRILREDLAASGARLEQVQLDLQNKTSELEIAQAKNNKCRCTIDTLLNELQTLKNQR